MYTEHDRSVGYVNPQALYFNGHCPDKEIEGFQTKSVAGRELMAHTLTALIVGNQDGEREQLSRYASRDIKVSYTLEASTATDLRDKYRALNVLLMGQNKQIWFGDDPDYYFVGTLSAADTPTDGMLKVTSTFTLHCPLPFAYGMREDSFSVAAAGTLDFKLDFANKIFGDFNSNPNKIYGAEWHEIENRKPDSLWWEWEQENYNKLAKQDGISGSYTRTDVGNSTRLVMRFDVINAIEQQMPGFWQWLGLIELSERLAWLSDHIKKFYVEVWSYGHGASGYGTKVQTWSGTEWIGTQTNTANQATKNTYSFAGQEAAAAMTDGYFYALTGTNDADVTTPTVSYLDYAALSVSVDVPAANDSVTVTNDGPLPVPIRFELTNHDDNGFFGLTSGKESILIGKPNDIDGGVVSKSERLFTTKQDNSIGLSQWTINNGILNDWNETPQQVGKFDLPYEKRWRVRNTLQGISTNWGPHTSNGRGWHGPSLYTEFANDSQGATGAINWSARAYVWIGGSLKQSGLTQVNISGPDRELLASVQLWSGINQHGSIKIRIGNHWAYIDENNPRWDNFFGSVVFKRHGDTYTVEVQDVEGGKHTKQTISYLDPDSAAIKAVGFTYWKAMWGSWDQITYQDFYDFWFQKDNVEDYVDVPNTFNDGDNIVIDGQNQKVTTKVNGTLNIGLQDVGSKPILAYPGKNVINVLHSDFASAPDITAYIRKKYL